MTKFRNHHLKTRLTLPRTGGGKGLVDIVGLHCQEISALVFVLSKVTALNLAARHNTNIQLTSVAQKKEEWTGKELQGHTSLYANSLLAQTTERHKNVPTILDGTSKKIQFRKYRDTVLQISPSICAGKQYLPIVL